MNNKHERYEQPRWIAKSEPIFSMEFTSLTGSELIFVACPFEDSLVTPRRCKILLISSGCKPHHQRIPPIAGVVREAHPLRAHAKVHGGYDRMRCKTSDPHQPIVCMISRGPIVKGDSLSEQCA